EPMAGDMDGYYDNDCLIDLDFETTRLVRDGATDCAQWTLRRHGPSEIAWIGNNNARLWVTAGSVYNAAMRHFVGEADVHGAQMGAPVVTLDRPPVVNEGAGVPLAADIHDAEGDTFTIEWDFDGDGNYGEGADRAVTSIEGVLDGPAAIRV